MSRMFFFVVVVIVVVSVLKVAVENMRRKREEETKAKELKDLETRLQKARTKRQLNEKLKVAPTFFALYIE